MLARGLSREHILNALMRASGLNADVGGAGGGPGGGGVISLRRGGYPGPGVPGGRMFDVSGGARAGDSLGVKGRA
jgi:hypothetical protein